MQAASIRIPLRTLRFLDIALGTKRIKERIIMAENFESLNEIKAATAEVKAPEAQP